MQKKLLILILLGLAIAALTIIIRAGNIGTTILWNISQEGEWLLPLVMVSALIDSINPCAFSILLLTLAFLFSIGTLRSRILKIGGFYILGIFGAYLLIGLGLFHALHLFNTPHFMGKLGAALLIALGTINIIKEFFPAFPVSLKIPAAAHRRMAELVQKSSLPAAFVLGILVGLCEFPCTGGPYLMVLGLLHDRGTYVNGIGYLLMYNLIFILPLVVALFIAGDKTLVDKIHSWQNHQRRAMRLSVGAIMLVLGIIIFLL